MPLLAVDEWPADHVTDSLDGLEDVPDIGTAGYFFDENRCHALVT